MPNVSLKRTARIWVINDNHWLGYFLPNRKLVSFPNGTKKEILTMAWIAGCDQWEEWCPETDTYTKPVEINPRTLAAV